MKGKRGPTYFDLLARKGRRLRRIVLSLIVVVSLSLAGLLYFYSPGSVLPSGVGPVGSTHEHADVRMLIDGEALDFGQSRYYLKSSYVHFEGDFTVHKHATGVTFGYLLRTLGMELDGTSLTLDDGRVLKDEGRKTLRFFVNNSPVSELSSYEITQGDMILVSYGGEDEIILLQ